MNRKMQQCNAWHPLGIPGEAWQGGQTAVSRTASPVTFLKIDQSESCGYRRKTRVITF
jgi:hypothetical protein